MATFRAPGRVNLIGGQVDYHEGFVVSLAIDRDVAVDATPRADDRVVARSRDLDGTVDLAADGYDDPTAVVPAWGRPIGGVLRALAESGHAPAGTELSISSTVPIGAGLSSSAAFEVAVAHAVSATAGIDLDRRALARVAQRAEHVSLGVPCGIQDQLTSVMARAGHALFVDCRSLAVEHLALPLTVAVVVVHSGVSRTLEGSPWTARRSESFAAAATLGLSVLRDATPEQVAHLPRARHVVSEIARVKEFAGALRTGEIDALGPLLLASHASSRDDMEVSIAELDALVECLVAAGATGARLTGGGFGGCVVALVPSECAPALVARATADYERRTGRNPTAWVVAPSDGARP